MAAGCLSTLPLGVSGVRLGCLFGVLCSIVVDVNILAVSNGKPISIGKYSPSLYLSVAYTVGIILLSAAFSQEVPVCVNIYHTYSCLFPS